MRILIPNYVHIDAKLCTFYSPAFTSGTVVLPVCSVSVPRVASELALFSVEQHALALCVRSQRRPARRDDRALAGASPPAPDRGHSAPQLHQLPVGEAHGFGDGVGRPGRKPGVDVEGLPQFGRNVLRPAEELSQSGSRCESGNSFIFFVLAVNCIELLVFGNLRPVSRGRFYISANFVVVFVFVTDGGIGFYVDGGLVLTLKLLELSLLSSHCIWIQSMW